MTALIAAQAITAAKDPKCGCAELAKALINAFGAPTNDAEIDDLVKALNKGAGCDCNAVAEALFDNNVATTALEIAAALNRCKCCSCHEVSLALLNIQLKLQLNVHTLGQALIEKAGCNCDQTAEELLQSGLLTLGSEANEISVVLSSNNCDCNAIAKALVKVDGKFGFSLGANPEEKLNTLAKALDQSCPCHETMVALLACGLSLGSTALDKAKTLAKVLKFNNICSCGDLATELFTHVTQKADEIAKALKDAGCTCDEVVEALNDIPGTPFDIVAITKAIKAAGCACDKDIAAALNTVFTSTTQDELNTIADAMKKAGCSCADIAYGIHDADLYHTATTDADRAKELAVALRNAGCSCSDTAAAIYAVLALTITVDDLGAALDGQGCTCAEIALALALSGVDLTNAGTYATAAIGLASVLNANTNTVCLCDQIAAALFAADGQGTFSLGANLHKSLIPLLLLFSP